MVRKSRIVAALGESALLLPASVQEALAANDRLKLALTLLQSGEAHADHPDQPAADLTAELRAHPLPGVPPAAVSDSRRDADGWLILPGAARLRGLLLTDLAAMRAPLMLAHADEAAPLLQRAQALTRALPMLEGDRIPPGLIRAQTAIEPGRDGPDSLHRLVMDLHKAVNALVAQLAEESIAGAAVWHLRDEHRPLVRAFMAGLNETAPLKLDHPGLDTTAISTAGRLVIQNDIGTTDAHVLLVHVEQLTALLTYTDAHARRLAFFQDLFKPFAVEWSEPSLRQDRSLDEPTYYTTTGRHTAADASELSRYLSFLGSRIVFLIDWNRARKQLRPFLPKGAPVRLLRWAAGENIGHRGFLQLGGARLVYEAIAFAQPTPLQYGERLDEVLGQEEAFGYLQQVLQLASRGLRAGHAERFIRDEIKAELARRFRTANAGLLAMALTHAERVFDLAATVHDSLVRHSEPGADSAAQLTAAAQRARRWEEECDAIVIRVRSLARRTARPQAYPALMHEADEAADGLEEAAFLLTHLPALAPPPGLLAPLLPLAAEVLAAAQESVKMYEAASHVSREGCRGDVQDFFAAVDRIVALEQEADASERAMTGVLLTQITDLRLHHLLSRLTRALERTADAFAVSALRLRDHVLDDVLTG